MVGFPTFRVSLERADSRWLAPDVFYMVEDKSCMRSFPLTDRFLLNESAFSGENDRIDLFFENEKLHRRWGMREENNSKNVQKSISGNDAEGALSSCFLLTSLGKEKRCNESVTEAEARGGHAELCPRLPNMAGVPVTSAGEDIVGLRLEWWSVSMLTASRVPTYVRELFYEHGSRG
ncbi:hypothetical protein BHE74_00019299 [Ensete ventricosum]|nr:hypothetical protein BHE74_00019299 [Ensete ventricosum]